MTSGRLRLSHAAFAAYATLFVSELPYQALFPLLPSIASQFQLSSVETGAVVAAAPVGVLAASLPLGALVQKIGVRAVTAIAGAALAVTSLAQAGAWDFWSLLVARATFGMAHGAAWIAAPALLATSVTHERRASATAAAMPVGAAGAIVSPIVAGFVGEHVGLSAPFVLCAIGGAIALAACFLGRGAVRSEPTDGMRVGSLEALREPRVRAAVTLTVVAALAANASSLLIAVQLGENGLSAGGIGTTFGVAAAMLTAASVLATVFGTAAARPAVGVLVTLLLAGTMVSVAISTTTIVVVAFAVTRALLLAVIYTVAYPLATAAGDATSATALALVAVAWAVGALSGPLLAGALAGSVGMQATYALLAAMTAVFAAGAAGGRRSTSSLAPAGGRA